MCPVADAFSGSGHCSPAAALPSPTKPAPQLASVRHPKCLIHAVHSATAALGGRTWRRIASLDPTHGSRQSAAPHRGDWENELRLTPQGSRATGMHHGKSSDRRLSLPVLATRCHPLAARDSFAQIAASLLCRPASIGQEGISRVVDPCCHHPHSLAARARRLPDARFSLRSARSLERAGCRDSVLPQLIQSTTQSGFSQIFAVIRMFFFAGSQVECISGLPTSDHRTDRAGAAVTKELREQT
jgi:hypothetical protein